MGTFSRNTVAVTLKFFEPIFSFEKNSSMREGANQVKAIGSEPVLVGVRSNCTPFTNFFSFYTLYEYRLHLSSDFNEFSQTDR